MRRTSSLESPTSLHSDLSATRTPSGEKTRSQAPQRIKTNPTTQEQTPQSTIYSTHRRSPPFSLTGHSPSSFTPSPKPASSRRSSLGRPRGRQRGRLRGARRGSLRVHRRRDPRGDRAERAMTGPRWFGGFSTCRSPGKGKQQR